MRERGWIPRVAPIAVGFVMALANVGPAASIGGGNGGSVGDPYGCKARVRAEMGIAPYTGHAYPNFWPKVARCVEASSGPVARSTQSAEANSAEKAAKKPEKPEKSAPKPERNAQKSAELLKQEKLSSEKPRARKDDKDDRDRNKTSRDQDKTPDAKSATLEPSSAPARLPALATPATVSEFGRRVALVTGNSKYEHVPTLPNATNDAEALAKTLQETGFQSVTLKTNLTRDQMNSALAEFAKVADTADWAAVYYSGHGIESRGLNYMIPVDAQLKVDRDVDLETVDITKVLSTIEGARKLRLIILDACRDNPFLGQMKRTVATRSIARGLAPIEPDAGILIVYSAKHGQIALDGDGNNSPFATALINRIQTPNLELRRLFDLVRDDVLATTGRQQQPFTYGSLSGSEDFFFETR
jgi:Caspase domain